MYNYTLIALISSLRLELSYPLIEALLLLSSNYNGN